MNLIHSDIGTKIRYRNILTISLPVPTEESSTLVRHVLAVSISWTLTSTGMSPSCAEDWQGREKRAAPRCRLGLDRRGSLRRCCCSWGSREDSAVLSGVTGNGIAGVFEAPGAACEEWDAGGPLARGCDLNVPMRRPHQSRRSGGCCGRSLWWWILGAPGSREWSCASPVARCRRRGSYGKLSPPGSIHQGCRVGNVKGKKMEGSKRTKRWRNV